MCGAVGVYVPRGVLVGVMCVCVCVCVCKLCAMYCVRD